MMSNNKILTVSYGTFSCTLEGFDDSFGTMKAIAEYFRGLSSDAPYFGAEPPQPDAEMLARIAQKEISRRVEAHQHDGKIHLSAIENRSEEKPTAPQALLRDEVENDPIADTANVAAAVAASVARDADTMRHAEVDLKEDDADDSAAPDIQTGQEADEPSVEAAKVPVVEADLNQKAVASAPVEDHDDVAAGQPDTDAEAFFANSTDAPGIEDEDEDLAAEHVAPYPDQKNTQNNSIAAKLQRIRAVVAQHDEINDEDGFVEDQHADDEGASQVEPDHLMANVRRDIEDALVADDAADLADQDIDDEDDDDDISTILGRLDAAEAAETAEADEDIVAVSQTSDDTLNNLSEENGPDADETDGDTLEDDDVEVVSEDAEEADTLTDEDNFDDDDDEAPMPRARVIKVKRADLEAAIENGNLEEYDDEQDDEGDRPSLDDMAPAKAAKSSLSAEDQAELANELAELEADMSPENTPLSDALDDENEAEDAPAAATARHVLPSIDDARSEDIDRLLAETDHQMDEPESATRRSAFSHLRAAVAATKADVAMGASDDDDAKDDDAYRNDLADVVRPRRPVSSSSRTERPGDARPAPLKLVAEQRIDIDRPHQAGPVRPRRVAAMAETTQPAPEGESFADYAAEMGATKLPQLLEAAAAYMSFVEGREQFSRPQLMTKVRQVNPEDGFSREDGLRSFGQLLRAGKIEKIKGGRFTVSEDIGYRPDHRAAS
ncbi:hypothetical protein [Sulfitobacter sp. MF3-043]|uniref:hypothetical protein n=1 Tax=Sulfitobacter sediminivivens TaxID=3252902 RepID=UPI0036DD2526